MPLHSRPCAAVRLARALPLFALLVSCTRDGGTDPTPAPTPPTPPTAATARIGSGGGSVSVPLTGGGTAKLVLPAGAVVDSQTFTLTPLATPPRARAAFTIAPAGLVLLKPATITVTLPSGAAIDPALTLTYVEGDITVAHRAAVDPANRTVAVRLNRLGVGAGSGPVTRIDGESRAKDTLPSDGANSAHPAEWLSTVSLAAARGAENLPGNFILEVIELERRLNSFRSAVNALTTNGSRDNLYRTQAAADGLLIGNLRPSAIWLPDAFSAWRRVLCARYDTEVSALQNLQNGDAIQQWVDRVKEIVRFADLSAQFAETAAQFNEAPCAGQFADRLLPVTNHFATFQDQIANTTARLNPLTDFFLLDSLRLPRLVNAAGEMGVLGLVDIQGVLLRQVRGVTRSLREGAYTDCRVNQKQAKQRELLVRLLTSPVYVGAADYGASDLVEDIEYCGMDVFVEAVDGDGQRLRDGVAGGRRPGVVTRTLTLGMADAQRVLVRGPLRALDCPTGSDNAEQLVFSAGPSAGVLQTVGTLTPTTGTNQYLPSSPLELTADSLRERAGIGAEGGEGRLTVHRTGGLCNGQFPNLTAHTQPLVTIRLAFFPALRITTASLPDAPPNAPYTATVAAEGGRTPYTFSLASGMLPAGLTLGTDGRITGTPPTLGTSTFRVRVRSDDGQQAEREFTLRVGATVRTRLYFGPANWTAVTTVDGNTTSDGGTWPCPVQVLTDGQRLRTLNTALCAGAVPPLLTVQQFIDRCGGLGDDALRNDDSPASATNDKCSTTMTLAPDGSYAGSRSGSRLNGRGFRDTWRTEVSGRLAETTISHRWRREYVEISTRTRNGRPEPFTTTEVYVEETSGTRRP